MVNINYAVHSVEVTYFFIELGMMESISLNHTVASLSTPDIYDRRRYPIDGIFVSNAL